jgi:hypothetical protein
VDVKGRRFPSGDDVSRHYWKNWSTRDDLKSLAHWEALFGENFRGLFVFAYHILRDRAPLPAEQLFEHRGELYGFVAVTLADYVAGCHQISPRWDTVAMPTDQFRQLARPMEDFLFSSPDTACRTASDSRVTPGAASASEPKGCFQAGVDLPHHADGKSPDDSVDAVFGDRGEVDAGSDGVV